MTGEGRISIGGFETWYRVVGDSTGPDPRKVPVLALHGGPGLPHESLEPLEALAHGGRPVVFYDQLGCGNSTRRGDPESWGVDLFLEELSAVRRELGLDRVHLLGHSWGGLLGMEPRHARRFPRPRGAPGGTVGRLRARTCPPSPGWPPTRAIVLGRNG